ncbi:MAG: amidohydrolase [Anaerolineaceae bacterium]|nr:amidohydrolase [Anaerolineaceae bacterium]
MADLLIADGAVRTAQGWLSPGYIVIQDGKIQAVAVGQASEALRGSASRVLNASGKAVLPGLTNGHTHFSQTLMRGLAAGRPLMRWLKELIWPLQAAMSVEEMQLAAQLGLVENLKCGVTTVIDHHKVCTTREHTRAVIEAAGEVGINCVIARLWADLGVNAEDADAVVGEMEEWYRSTKEKANPTSGAYLRFASGPGTPWRCSDETILRMHDLAVKNGSFTHIHAAETKDDIEMSLEKHGETSIRWLDNLGVLGPNSQVVHSVWVDDEEIELFAERNALVVHCPVSNAVLGSGIAPIPQMVEKGVRLRLGTDGPASNDTQDIFETIKMALSLARVHSLDAAVLPPAFLLSTAADGKNIQVGAPADLTVVNLEHERAVPVHDYDSALVLCCHGTDVDTVIVGGKILMEGRKVFSVDETVLLQECSQAIRSLRKRAGIE